MTEILVGLDLSPAAAAALRWAADHARQTGLPLRGIHAAHLPYRPAFGDANALFALHQQAELPEEYRQSILQVWNQANPEPGWRLQYYLGEPGPVLTALAADAALLVVGTHFHVGLGRVFPGSVSHYCLTHSPIPLVAVPAAAEPSVHRATEARFVHLTEPAEAQSD